MNWIWCDPRVSCMHGEGEQLWKACRKQVAAEVTCCHGKGSGALQISDTFSVTGGGEVAALGPEKEEALGGVT